MSVFGKIYSQSMHGVKFCELCMFIILCSILTPHDLSTHTQTYTHTTHIGSLALDQSLQSRGVIPKHWRYLRMSKEQREIKHDCYIYITQCVCVCVCVCVCANSAVLLLCLFVCMRLP